MKSLFLGVFSVFLLEISLEMLIKRIPINIVLLCLKDVIGFLFIEFQEKELYKSLFLGVLRGFLLEISLEMLIKRFPLNIVLLCLKGVWRFLFIEFQERELHENHCFQCFKGVHTES